MTRSQLRLAIGAVVLLAIVAAAAWIYTRGTAAGGDAVRVDVAEQRIERQAEARADERAATATTAAIAERTVRAEALTDAIVQSTIQELCDALVVVPQPMPSPADGPPAAALPAAPVDRLRDALNAGITRANQAVEPVTIDRGILAELVERFAEAIGAIERGDRRALAVGEERVCVDAVLRTGSAPAGCGRQVVNS